LAQLKLRSKHFFEYILQFEASTEKRRAAVLRSVYELASRSLPNDPQIWLAYIRFEMNEMKDHAKALAIYQRVIKSSEKEISIDCKNEFSRLYGEQK
jgi:hypothetical protein